MRLETTAQVGESDEATRHGGQATGASSRLHPTEMASHGIRCGSALPCASEECADREPIEASVRVW